MGCDTGLLFWWDWGVNGVAVPPSKWAGKVGSDGQSEGFADPQCVSSSLSWLFQWPPWWVTQFRSHRQTQKHLTKEEALFLPACFKNKKKIFPRGLQLSFLHVSEVRNCIIFPFLNKSLAWQKDDHDCSVKHLSVWRKTNFPKLELLLLEGKRNCVVNIFCYQGTAAAIGRWLMLWDVSSEEGGKRRGLGEILRLSNLPPDYGVRDVNLFPPSSLPAFH